MPWEQPDVAGLRGESSSKFNRDPKDIVPPKPKESHSYSTIKPGEKQQTVGLECNKETEDIWIGSKNKKKSNINTKIQVNC